MIKAPRIKIIDYDTMEFDELGPIVTPEDKATPIKHEPSSIVVSEGTGDDKASVKFVSECPVTTNFIQGVLKLIRDSLGYPINDETTLALKAKILGLLGADGFDYNVEIEYDMERFNEHIDKISILRK